MPEKGRSQPYGGGLAPLSIGLSPLGGGDMLACARITRIPYGFRIEIHIGKLSICIEIS